MLAAAMSELTGKPPTDFSEPPFVKGKRGLKRKFSQDPDQEKNDANAVRFHIGGERFAYVKRFTGRVHVNIGEYYFNKNKLLAAKKGLNLTAEEWMNLSERSKDITQAIEMV